MKNMRKIVAILAAALMLFSVLPMSAFATAGDVAYSNDFNDGTNGGFERSYNENGYIVFDATTADWQNTYQYVGGIKANTLYKVTFKAMANKDAELTFKISNDWATYPVVETVAVTTDWQDYELTVNSGDVNAPYVLFSSGYTAASAPIYCIDDLKIVETVDPALIGKVVNGDFSDNSGWALGNGATIADGVLNLNNPNLWGEAALQTVPAKANTNYEITWKSQRISGTGAFNLFVMDASNANLTKVAGQNWMNETSGNWVNNTYTINTGASEVIKIKFSTEANNPGQILIDDFKITEIKDPSYDGYITDGDLETGTTKYWESVWGSAQISVVEGGHNGDYAMQIDYPGQWQLVRQKVTVKPNTDYVYGAYTKNVTGSPVLLVKSVSPDANIKQGSISSSSDWKKHSLEFNSGDNTEVYVAVMSNGAGDSVTVDDFFMFEKAEASNDGYIVNGTFETFDLSPWYNLWGSCPTSEVVKGGKDDNFALNVVSGQWKHVRQVNIAVEPNTDYKVSAWAKNSKNMALLVKGQSATGAANGEVPETGDIKSVGMDAGDEWTLFTNEFNSGDHNYVLVSLMGTADEAYGTFDNIVMEKVVPACEHEYDNACDVDCNLCYEAREVEHSVQHVEAVPATCTVGGNIEHWYCDVCGMAWLDEAQTQNTNLKAVKLPAAHTFDYECSTVCSVCYEEVREASHSLTYVEAVEAVDCQTPGHIAYYQCEYCSEMYADADGIEVLNPWFISITVECTRPEDAADCAIVPCEVCGNDTYGYGEHDVVACQGGVCGKCGDTIEGYGCANYDTPACEDGVCYYCGGFVAGYGHENGAWADCLDGECAYGCGLQYPATADHVDAEGDDYCDNCWNHLAHVDEDANGECDICWSQLPHDCIDENGDGFCDFCWGDMPVVEIIYGDANGDGEVTGFDAALLQQYVAGWTVELDMAAADANGDGEVTGFDAALLQQYVAGWDVDLGPATV